MSQRILITGVSGFLAKHIALQALQKGYAVRGTLRALNKADQVKRTLAEAGANIRALEFAAADLTNDEGWDAALEGCDSVVHVASPFPIQQPAGRMDLVPAARGGVVRVLEAAGPERRIVMTSSMVAMMYRAGRPSQITVREDDWTDTAWPALSAYVVSKTLAERAAWDHVETVGDRRRLTAINPGLVLGPALDDDVGASIEIVKLLAKGAYPALPAVSYPVVDVRDVAALHLAALENSAAGGRRLVAAAQSRSFAQIASAVIAAQPGSGMKAPRELPPFVVRIAAAFDARLRAVTPDLGVTPIADAAYVEKLTGVAFRPADEAIRATVNSLRRIEAT